jgi:hypothetical protein
MIQNDAYFRPSQVHTLLDRGQIGAMIEALVDLLDIIDGDPDLEPDGDELDGCDLAEDEFQQHLARGPGCPLSDPGGSGSFDHDARDFMTPAYGVDQSRGPVNELAASRAFLKNLRGGELRH